VIQILELENGYAPIIVCDQCGLRIDDAELAAAIAPESDKFKNDNRRVLHVHKGPCFDAVAKMEDGKCSWEELSRHMRYLIHNVKLKP